MSRRDYNSRYRSGYHERSSEPLPTEEAPVEAEVPAPEVETPEPSAPPKPKTPSFVNLEVTGCARLNVRERPFSTSNIKFVVLEGTKLVGDTAMGEDWIHVTEVSPSKRDGYVMTKFVKKV